MSTKWILDVDPKAQEALAEWLHNCLKDWQFAGFGLWKPWDQMSDTHKSRTRHIAKKLLKNTPKVLKETQ